MQNQNILDYYKLYISLTSPSLTPLPPPPAACSGVERLMSACGPDVPPSRRPDDLDLSTPATRRRRVHDVESVLRCIFFKCVRAGPAATERDCREAPPDALAATWLRRQGNCVHNLSVSCLVFVRTVEGGVRAAAGKGAREGGVAAAAADGGARGTSGRGMTPASSLRRAGGSCGKEVRVFVRALRAFAPVCAQGLRVEGTAGATSTCGLHHIHHIHHIHRRRPSPSAATAGLPASGAPGGRLRGGSSGFSDVCALDRASRGRCWTGGRGSSGRSRSRSRRSGRKRKEGAALAWSAVGELRRQRGACDVMRSDKRWCFFFLSFFIQ